jgi:hypothetical protein
MPKSASLEAEANFRGKSFTIHAFGTRRAAAKDAIEHWMPPLPGLGAAGKDAQAPSPQCRGLRVTYAHATAHLRCSLPYLMPNDCFLT